MSLKMAYFPVLGSLINPIAIPDTGFVIFMPASINAIVPAQTVAMDDEPLDSKISDTNLIVYGLTSGPGITGLSALSAKFPCPISRRAVPLMGFTSPVENGGKL